MFNVTGDDWKLIRATFSPIFTSGKLKGMVTILEGMTKLLTKEFAQFVDKNEMFNLKETFGKFSMDSIASCAFGVDAQSFTNSDGSQFVENARNIFKYCQSSLATTDVL
jgi:cytochrome P450